MNILPILIQYWPLVVVVVVALIWVPFHIKQCREYAKKQAFRWLYVAERNAEILLINTDITKVEWAANKAYDWFPPTVRLFVSKPMFTAIVDGLLKEAVALAKAHQIQPPTQLPDKPPDTPKTGPQEPVQNTTQAPV